MMNLSKVKLAAAVLAVAVTLTAQNRTRFAGMYNAYDYAYGIQKNIPALQIDTGSATAGTYNITLAFGYIVLGDGTHVNPLSTTAPITVGSGSNAETVTPSAVSCGSPAVLDTCVLTATFSNPHGAGERVTSGSFGLVEAVNAAHNAGGGLVIIDQAWTQAGGVNGTITGNKGWTNVSILDGRGTVSGSAFSYKAASNGANHTVSTVSWY
jgi:hypothetical protein